MAGDRSYPEDAGRPMAVMASMSEDHALREAELLIMRQVHTQLERNNGKLDALHESVGDVRERLARMETTGREIAELKADNAKLWEQITILNADRNARSGAAKLLEWFWRFGPWFLGGAAAAYTLLRDR